MPVQDGVTEVVDDSPEYDRDTVSVGEKFKVKGSDVVGLSEGVKIRVESITTDSPELVEGETVPVCEEVYVTLSAKGRGLELDVPAPRFFSLLDSGDCAEYHGTHQQWGK